MPSDLLGRDWTRFAGAHDFCPTDASVVCRRDIDRKQQSPARRIFLAEPNPRQPMRSLLRSLPAALALAVPSIAPAQTTVAQEFEKLHFRSIGPATMSGRIADVAVYEANPAIYYVGSAHGGVWKTVNNGATYEPQFQDNGLMAI